MFNSATQTYVFPWVTFTCSRQNKEFCIPRESVLHVENFQERDRSTGEMKTSENVTYVNFVNPNEGKGKVLHAVVDMPVSMFRDCVLRPAYMSDETATS